MCNCWFGDRRPHVLYLKKHIRWPSHKEPIKMHEGANHTRWAPSMVQAVPRVCEPVGGGAHHLTQEHLLVAVPHGACPGTMHRADATNGPADPLDAVLGGDFMNSMLLNDGAWGYLLHTDTGAQTQPHTYCQVRRRDVFRFVKHASV
eukprot:m.1539774 g.1539774  ORF g.1539774 m.1539774 type:complete len:147 (-) comp25246_c0_seq26:3761-4201(-)